ncbi:glycerol-3-phosphate acyltransferase 1, mitochondrial-like [Lineus longissimus]|uniref:glycerol-3-phosphate acyltransferase 1, mitochondrial-like n=1 Tax=Lineus longissimus TaxID=88925 RepID=UPI002B4C2E83
MGDTLKNLQGVYERWENKPGSSRNVNGYDPAVNAGKQAWRKKFGDNIGPAPHQRTRRYKNTIPTLPKNCLLGDFKSHPMRAEHAIFKRPFMGRCCNCVQISRNTFYTDNVTMAGSMNILRVDTEDRGQGLFTNLFCHIAYVMKRDISHKYPDITKAVLSSDRIQDAIDEEVINTTEDAKLRFDRDNYEKVSKKCQKRVTKLLKNMKAAISRKLIRFTGWFLLKLLGSLLNSIVVHHGQMEMIKKASQKHKHVPLIFLPLHRSHLDYIILTYTLFHWDISAPYVAAGDNLRIPFFSFLMRSLGGFFIRRKLDRQTGKKDVLYRAVLQSYMCELLREGQSIEFFIEGGRSRTGKACFPKAGLLSVIVDAYLEGVVPDVYIVPLSISYEKILDGNFTNEQMGVPKNTETFWMAVKAIWRRLRAKFGNVRVDFCQPFSLQEYLEVAPNFPGMRKLHSSGNNSSNDESNPSQGQIQRISGSSASLYGTDVVIEEQRMMVQSLAEHIVYNSVNATAIMSTNLLAFVLLTQHRQGACLSEVAMTFEWLKDEITVLKGRDVGFTGETKDVIFYAADVLGEQLVSVAEPDGADKEIFISPNLSLPNIFELAYYSNVVTAIFLFESVAAASTLACSEDIMTNSSPQPISVSKNQLSDKVKELHQLLKFEFMFAPSCESQEMRVLDGIDILMTKGVFSAEEEKYGTTDDRRAAQRLSSMVSWDDEDSDEEGYADEVLKVDAESDGFIKHFPFLLNVLGPIIESYWVTACHLLKLVEADMEEQAFIKEVLRIAQDRVTKNTASYAESASFETIKTAMRSFQHEKVLEVYYLNDVRMISLCDNYANLEEVSSFVEKVEEFRCYM